MSWYKIGFHTGPGGNKNGIGDHWRQLDAAGIPATLVAVDEYGPCYELANIRQASGVPHRILFRLNDKIPNFNPDVPQYNLSPSVAAAHWWQTIRASLPPELIQGNNREHVWLVAGNEVDKDRASWLGAWAEAVARLANPDGWKIAAFGWSSGEPEPEHWQEAGMLGYLRYCENHPDQAAVALHEYSYTMNLSEGYPWRVGRYSRLLDVCHHNAITAPRIFITEFGWTYNDAPSPEVAMPQLAWAADLYADSPEVEGAAIWYLGDGYGGIDNRIQRLIAPVTAAALAIGYTKPKPPEPPAGEELKRRLQAAQTMAQDLADELRSIIETELD